MADLPDGDAHRVTGRRCARDVVALLPRSSGDGDRSERCGAGGGARRSGRIQVHAELVEGSQDLGVAAEQPRHEQHQEAHDDREEGDQDRHCVGTVPAYRVETVLAPTTYAGHSSLNSTRVLIDAPGSRCATRDFVAT